MVNAMHRLLLLFGIKARYMGYQRSHGDGACIPNIKLGGQNNGPLSETSDCYPTDWILWGDMAAPQLSLQTLKALSGMNFIYIIDLFARK
jgi:hypothetical protein